ncbi:restriction endonuclease subunit S [Pseudoalteromonas distincta]|uniref:restriction endonuclease subunit S n=1 Tax=Pseudoalteromonas distincta TaxID=77608 RepID=UPI00352EF64B
MSNLSSITLGELARGYRGVSYTPDQLLEHMTDTSFTLLRSNNIDGGFLNFTKIQIVPDNVVNEEQILKSGDIAVCMSNGSKALVGKSAAYKNVIGRHTVGAFCSVFRPYNTPDSAFLSHVFQSNSFRKYIDFILAGSAINNLKNCDIEEFELINFAPNERLKIAEVLDVFNVQIRETEVIIAKLQQVKQGLSHDLLTRGVDENGQLRPSYQDAPELYQPSELGWIPKDWEVCSLAKSINLISGQHIESILCNEESKGSPYFTGPSDFLGATTLISKYTEYPQVMCETGDILITVKGSGCGKVAISNCDACISRQLMAIQVNPKVTAFWLALFQNHREKFNQMATGGNIPGISRNQILELLIRTPKLDDELIAIGNMITGIDAKINGEELSLEKLKLKKSGLMDDLLTGKVRVTDLITQAKAS